MSDHNDLTRLRRYVRADVAEQLNVSETWLKEWVTGRKVPHQRSGRPGPRQRGVWFTYDDILAIGRMLPELMSDRQANGRAESLHMRPALAAHPGAVADALQQYAGLRSLRTPS